MGAWLSEPKNHNSPRKLSLAECASQSLYCLPGELHQTRQRQEAP